MIPRLAVLPDFREEGWPSMDLCADMLWRELRADPTPAVEHLFPPFRHRLIRIPWLNRCRAAVNADRLLNRFSDYPRHLRRHSTKFDLFHICDHSYAQLVHALPSGRAGVYCHDLDTFRCILEPQRDPRPWWFRRMTSRTLDGFRKAAVVFFSTHEVHRQILAHGLIDPARLVHAPYGVSPEFTAEPGPEDAEPLPNHVPKPFLLHVGSSIPRKRIDVLLDVFAAVHKQHPELWLLQVGGEWTAEQRGQLQRLGIRNAVRQVRGLTRTALAALYRRAALVLLPSEAEGFGLPVIEALACGACVVASDIAVLREVGGEAVLYCAVADVGQWVETVTQLLSHSESGPARETRLQRAALYSWKTQAQTIAGAYKRLLGIE